jgi:Ni,Fe-hydrogenase III large subunit
MINETPNLVTGIHFSKDSKFYYKYIYEKNQIQMEKSPLEDPIEIFEDERIPLWLLRHSVGKEGKEENLERILITPKDNYLHFIERGSMLYGAMLDSTTIRNLDYRGIKLDTAPDEYCHAVGPIHAGIIEPGHFRFIVRGEEIQNLTIRLGFQKRNILQKLQGLQIRKAFPIVESISGDSSVAYASALAEIIEKSSSIPVPSSVLFLRAVLLELERIAIHIGDIGAIGGDIGYYPILGLCSTDRGVPLGFMELLTGSRFGRGAIQAGNIFLNKHIQLSDLKQASTNLQKAFQRIESQFIRIHKNSTIRERTYQCGEITQEMVTKNGFVGMPAKCTGINLDLRNSNPLYSQKKPLSLELNSEEMNGDVWARWYLRYWELKNSVQWVTSVIEEAYSDFINTQVPKYDFSFKEGMHFSAVEGWRGPVLVSMELDNKGIIQDSYIRDPSVLNWHALEIAVRGELIGDFPLNNKSFNLSYVGFDL